VGEVPVCCAKAAEPMLVQKPSSPNMISFALVRRIVDSPMPRRDSILR